jgi:Mg-chelatase subunit ChlD
MRNQAWKKITVLFLTVFLVLSSSLPSLGLLEASANGQGLYTDEITEYTKLSLSEKMEDLLAELDGEQQKKPLEDIQNDIKQYIDSDEYLGFNRVSSDRLIGLIKNLVPKLKDKEQEKDWTRVALALNAIIIEDVSVIVSDDSKKAKQLEAKKGQVQKQYEQAFDLYEKGNYTGAVSHVNNSFRQFFDSLQSIGFAYKLDGDTDGDGLLDIEEFVYHSNPLKVDTDADGLTDFFEMKQAFTNPSKTDSDDNGITDDKEDKDKDGLSNKQEQDHDANPLKADTDDDKLMDGEEVKVGTNPNQSDTDQDKLMDGEEDPLGFDPTNKDTDGNGIIDGEERVSVTTSPNPENQDEHIVPSVTIESAAAEAGKTTITNLKDRNSFLTEEIPGYLGSAYDFETEVEFEEAEMTFSYDPAVVTEDFRPEIFYYNEAEQRLERLENQTHDPENGTVTTTVTHFSSYLLLNGVEWDKAWSQEVGLPSDRDDENNGEIEYLDIVFAIDSSGSMSWNDPNELRKDAVKNFIDTLLEKDKGAVVDFDSSARVVVSLTSDKQALKVAVDTIDDVGGTNIYSALNRAVTEVIKGQNSKRYVILLTDGEGTWSESALQNAINHDVTVYTIGLGSDVDVALLQRIASETGGKYYHASTADELDDRFGDVADETTEDGGKDSDNDGIPDSLEKNGVRIGNGQYITTDPNNPDSDGDLLLDGDELVLQSYGENQYATMVSDPNKADSDFDGLVDSEEMEFATDPFDNDSDGDSLKDATEVWEGFDPLNRNPDQDSYPDAEELANGTDPFLYDATAWEFGQNVLLGALWGDGGKTAVNWGILSETTYNSMAYLSGQILSGLVAIGDIRDAVGNIFNGDPWGVVLSLVGVVPLVGDAAKIAAEIMTFAKRTSQNFDKAIYFVDSLLRKIDESAANTAFRQLAGSCNCFVAGTKVLTDDGEKPIEEISEGDKVLSKDEETGEVDYKEVTQLYQNEKNTTYKILIGGQTIETTENHPFWVEGKGWVFAADLHVGDPLQQSHGQTLEIQDIQVVQHKEPVQVYNFTVADFHTYFVSDLGIWVHNVDCSYLGKLTYDFVSKTWTSSSGLIYGQGSVHGNRVKHVLAHTVADPSKPRHSVFNVAQDRLLNLIDEAWNARSGVTPILQRNGNEVYNIPMGRVVGTQGETSIRIVVKKDTSEIITSFPVK